MEHIRDTNTRIAAAAERQSAVAEAVNRRITHPADNLASTGDAAGRTQATSERLVDMVEVLRDTVHQFRGSTG